MKKTLFKALIPTMAMILVAIMALTGTTYAWFTNVQVAKVDNIDIKVTSASSMKVAVAKSGSVSSWTSNLLISDIKASDGSNIPVYSSAFEAVSSTTGKGGSFYVAEIDESDSTKLVNGASNNDKYLKFEVYVWNDSNENRYVSLASSAISGDSGVKDSLRISMVDMTTVKTSYTDGAAFTSIAGSEGNAKIWETSGTVSGTKAIKTGFTGPIANDDASYTEAVAAANITGNAADVKVQVPAHGVQKIAIYIWLEGQDANCVNAITEKTATIALKLDGTQTY